MEDTKTLKLVAKGQMPFYFKTNDKVAWIAREHVNIAVIVRTSDITESDTTQGATKKIDLNLKFLNLETGESVKEFVYKLAFDCPVLELVCDFTTTSGYPLLNVFARLEGFRSCVVVFSCLSGEELKKEAEITVEACSTRSDNFRLGTSVSFIKASPLRNGQYWLAVILTDGNFMLFKMTVQKLASKGSNPIRVSCFGPIRSTEMKLNVAFSWRLLDFSPDQKHIAIIGRGSYVFYIGLAILDVDSSQVIAEEQLKGFHSVADAKYSEQGNFFLALCSGQRLRRTEGTLNVDIEDCKSVVIWDTLGNLLHKVNFVLSEIYTMSCFEVFSSPHDNYIIIPQVGLDSNGNQFSIFLKHTLNFSQPETKLHAEELLRIDHSRGSDNYTSCVISPSGYQFLVIHCCNTNVDNRDEDVSNLLVYRMKNSPEDLKVLCRVAVRNHYFVQKLRKSEVPKEILAFLNWS